VSRCTQTITYDAVLNRQSCRDEALDGPAVAARNSTIRSSCPIRSEQNGPDRRVLTPRGRDELVAAFGIARTDRDYTPRWLDRWVDHRAEF